MIIHSRYEHDAPVPIPQQHVVVVVVVAAIILVLLVSKSLIANSFVVVV